MSFSDAGGQLENNSTHKSILVLRISTAVSIASKSDNVWKGIVLPLSCSGALL